MKYTNQTIDKVRDADIVKTISSFPNCDLKKAGANYKCSSPFAEEKTPSFVVSPVKQIFKCFSSGIAGDGIKFVEKHKSVDFLEAIKIIAEIHNIHLDTEEVTPQMQQRLDQKAEMYKLVKEISSRYRSIFNKLENKHWAKKILAQREFNQDSLITFEIGYNEKSNALTNWTINNGTFGIAKEIGISDSKNGMSYDKFKDRIIFPILNDKGTVVGFGGRRSDNEEVSKYPKYLNTASSLIYDKSTVLYGLYQAKKTINKKGSAILTEGYTDVISMHQNGCDNTIASCGTALTNRHAQLIKRYATEIIILRDGDKAGQNAVIRDIDVCLANGLNVNLCVLPDGEDPDSFSRKQKDMQTWISKNKQDAILWKVARYDLKRDRYDDDVNDIKESAKTQIKALTDTIIDLEKLEIDYKKGFKKLKKENPKKYELKLDSNIKSVKEHNKNKLEQIAEVKKESKEELQSLNLIDPHKKQLAVTNIANSLFLIKHEINRYEYIKQVAKLLKIAASALKAEIGKFEIKDQEKRDKNEGKLSLKGINLPEGANQEEYLEGHGFITIGNCYHFIRLNNNSFFQGTTFRLQPLFHIQGDKENKKLCEIINLQGKKKLIDFDSDMLANFNEFRKYLFRIGGFMFLTHNGMRTEHFDKFVYRYEQQFEPALELLTMGWNKKGFFAFANGVYWNGKFQNVNKYGIMRLEGVDTTDTSNGYHEKIENYYSPAFSIMHIDNQEGDDLYENDRYFVYKNSNITLKQWMEQLILVFGEKGISGTLFNFGAIFRDLFISHTTSFPLLGGFGEKDSGKSAFGKILQNFFYYRLPALDLTQATHVGFSRRLSRNTNTTQFCDEYQDKNVREDVFNGLMGAWNGIGREKGKGVGTNRTSYDKINSAIYYAGQFMPTKMENALATRTISHFFQTKNYTTEQKDNFNKLLNCTNSGISSLVVDIVQHRAYFEQQLPTVHAESERTLKQLLKDEQYQERVFGNVSVLLTTFMILETKLDFPFNQKQVENLCTKLIVDNSSQIADSNGLTEFWSIITYLYETSQIKLTRDFLVENPVDFKILGAKRKSINYENEGRKKILFLRLKSVYQYYNKEVTKREGVDVIGQTTLRHYFKSRKYFIGLVKGRRFGEFGSQSCYAFDYDMMEKQGLLTLEKDNSIPFPTEPGDVSTERIETKKKDDQKNILLDKPTDELPF